jgi:hypothetical protein
VTNTPLPLPRDPELEERWRNANLRHRAEAARQKADEALDAGDAAEFAAQRGLESRIRAVILPKLSKGYAYTNIPAGAFCGPLAHAWKVCEDDDEDVSMKMRCEKCGLAYGRRIVR